MLKKKRTNQFVGFLLVLLALAGPVQRAWTRETAADYKRVFGIDPALEKYKWSSDGVVSVQLIGCSAPATIFWPGETARFQLQLENRGKEELGVRGRLRAIPYRMLCATDNFAVPRLIWLRTLQRAPGEVAASAPLTAKLAVGGFTNLDVELALPERFGGYGLVLELDDRGRFFVGSCVRVMKPSLPARRPFYRLTMDLDYIPSLLRTGTAPNRLGVAYLPTDRQGFDDWYTGFSDKLAAFAAAGLPVTLEFGAPNVQDIMPLGRKRPWLDDNDVMRAGKGDMAWLPRYDQDFKKLVKQLALEHGWPKGPINAMMLWNEPWNGISISGWGADDERYREIFMVMCKALEEARKEAGVQVLLGGCDSTSNTWDKLFCYDGKSPFLKHLDFVSEHYQGMNPETTARLWTERRGADGKPDPVQFWDTESWVANTDERLAPALAIMCAQGMSRMVGVCGGAVVTRGTEGRHKIVVRTESGTERRLMPQSWSVAASVAAWSNLVAERPFKEFLFRPGLPWVFVFSGPADNPDDGTLLVVGDIGGLYGRKNVALRGVLSEAEAERRAKLQARLRDLPAAAAEREAIEQDLARELPLRGVSMSLADGNGRFHLLDCYGNRVPAANGRLTVPLSDEGWYLRPDGSRGSWQALLAAVREARIDGYEPLDVVVHEPTRPIDAKAVVRLKLTNVLNRSINGTLSVVVGKLQVKASAALSFAPHESKEVSVRIVGGKATAANRYPLIFRFDAGADGTAYHNEDVHVRLISRRTITVDGDLKDWQGVLPNTFRAVDAGPTMTEAAWLPFKAFDQTAKKGLATIWLAADKTNFYLAAKIADDTLHPGTLRFARRDDDEFFYPEVSKRLDRRKTLAADFVDFARKPPRWSRAEAGRFALQTPDGKGRIQAGWTPKYNHGKLGVGLELPRPTKVTLHLLSRRDRLWAHQWATYRAETPIGGKRLQGEWLDGHFRTGPRARQDQAAKGVFLSFLATGKVRIEIQGKPGLCLDGIFFDVPSTEQAQSLASGKPIRWLRPYDFKTGSSWRQTYGKQGWLLPGLTPRLPANVKAAILEHVELEKLQWPTGVRRFSYRKNPVLPHGPGFDNLQIAFNVLPAADKPLAPYPPGTIPGFIAYYTNDYEYALNQVAAKYGGGYEIWRCRHPKLPNKHFYPRQLPSRMDGAVPGKLVVKYADGARFVEAAIPWSEIPEVRARMATGKPLKFDVVVNDDGGARGLQLSRDKSVSRPGLGCKPDWYQRWNTEIQFGWEPEGGVQAARGTDGETTP